MPALSSRQVLFSYLAPFICLAATNCVSQTLIRITPSGNAKMTTGTTQQLTATGRWDDGRSHALPVINWRSTRTDIVQIEQDGTAIAKAAGRTVIFALAANTPAGEGFAVTVTDPAPSVLQSFGIVQPDGVVQATGKSIQLKAVGTYKDAAGNINSRPVAAGLKWLSSDSKKAIVDPATGVVVGLMPGTVTITATCSAEGLAAEASVQTVTLVFSSPSGARPHIGAKLISGSKSVTVLANPGDSVSVYQFDATFNPGSDCSDSLTEATLLNIVTAPNTSATSLVLSGAPPYVLTLSQPMIAGTGICVSDRQSAVDSAPTWSSLVTVGDPDDYGRVRTYFIAGVQVSNQQAANASSTAGQYLEAGFNFSWARARDGYDQRTLPRPGFRRTPGFATNLDIRLSPIPVSAPVTVNQTTMTSTTTTPPGGTPTPPTTPTATVSTIPNVLSSQQSARVNGSLYFPFKTTSWNDHVDYFTVGPTLRAGFATLLNPTVASPPMMSAPVTTATSTMNVTTTSTSTITTTMSGSFNTAYSFAGYGMRLAWDRFPAATDKSPQTISQFLVTLGSYSSLPSYVCQKVPTGGTAPANNTTSACGLAGTPLAMYPILSRTLVPRLDIEGFAKLPNYPFVLGMDANLAQYSIFSRQKVDYLNKPGNDIRIYVGFKIDLNTLVSKLGVSSQ